MYVMLARIVNAVNPSKRQAFRRMIGWSALAFFFILWAWMGGEPSIASLGTPFWVIAAYYLLIWRIKVSRDNRVLADHEQSPSIMAEQSSRPSSAGTLRVPPPLN